MTMTLWHWLWPWPCDTGYDHDLVSPFTIFRCRLWPWPCDPGYDHDLVTQAITMTLCPPLPYSVAGYDHDLVTLAMTMTWWPSLTIFRRRLWPWPFDLGLPYSIAGYDHDLLTLAYHIPSQAMTMNSSPSCSVAVSMSGRAEIIWSLGSFSVFRL